MIDSQTKARFPYVNVDRQFSVLDKNIRPDRDILGYVRKLSGDQGWDALLTRKRVVLLAEAGSGKTCELEEASKRLRSAGKESFFIRIDVLAASGLRSSCAPDEIAFDNWLASEQPGWFFLDSRDEAKLTNQSFRRALTNFRVALGNSLARVHVIVSSRVSDWRPIADLSLVESILESPPTSKGLHERAAVDLDPLLAPIRRRESHRPVANAAEPKTEATLVVAMLSLDKARIATIARTWGIGDSATFIEALEREDSLELASRPLDLLGLVGIWIEKGTLGDHEDLILWSINTRLDDNRSLDLRAERIEPAICAAGARRLAAALTLSRTEAFLAPDSGPHIQDDLALDPYKVFPDWKQSAVDAVLSTALFDPHSYGRARFHTRVAREYLSARWLYEMKPLGGLTRRELDGLLFADSYGEKVVVPSLQPIAAWLSLWDSAVREEVISRDPEILLSYGDPFQLDLATKRKLLGRTLQRVATGIEKSRDYDERVLRGISDSRLAEDFRKYWRKAQTRSRVADSHGRIATQRLLLRLIRAGRVVGCKELALAAASKMHSHDILQRLAASALAAISEPMSLARFVRALLKNRNRWSVAMLRESIENFFPGHLTVTQFFLLVDSLLRLTSDEMSGIRYAALTAVAACGDPADRSMMLLGLAKRLRPSRERSEHDDRASPKWKQLGPAFVSLAAQVLEFDKPSELPPEVLLALAAGRTSAMDHYESDTKRERLTKAIDAWHGRPGFFWFLVENYSLWASGFNDRRDHRIYYTDSFIHLSESDLSWILTDSISRERRLNAMEAAILVWMRAQRSGAVMARIKKYAEKDSELEKVVLDAERPIKESDAFRRMRKRDEKYKAEQRAADQQRDDGWKLFRESVKQELVALVDPSQRHSKEQYIRLTNFYRWMEANSPRGDSRYSISNWEDLKESFGIEVAEATAIAFKHYWRGQKQKLPSEKMAEDRNSTLYTTIFGLVGLAIEHKEGHGWLEAVSTEDVETAVRLAFSELNGFPPWLISLIRRFPDIVIGIFAREVRWALLPQNADAGADLLQRIRYDDISKEPSLKSLILTRLSQADGLADKPLAYAIDILARGDVRDHQALGQLARSKLDSAILVGAQRLLFLKLLFIADPLEAIGRLNSILQALPRLEAQSFAETVFAAFWSRREPMKLVSSEADRVKSLEKLVFLAYEWINPQEDLKHEGVYESSTRDNAEQGRASLLRELADTPGRATFEALCRLAQQSILGRSREWVRNLARERAEQDAGSAWKPIEVEQFESTRSKRPTSGKELFTLALRRFDEINDQLSGGDFSQAELLGRFGTAERDFQLWTADRLDLLARGAYVVVREEEVIRQKKPDIRLHSPLSDSKVAIELKIAGSYSGPQLQKAIKNQLIDQYLNDERCRFGIFVLTAGGKKKSWKIGASHAKSVDQLVELLRRSSQNPTRRNGAVLEAAILRLEF